MERERTQLPRLNEAGRAYLLDRERRLQERSCSAARRWVAAVNWQIQESRCYREPNARGPAGPRPVRRWK